LSAQRSIFVLNLFFDCYAQSQAQPAQLTTNHKHDAEHGAAP
jgi:hypothetical protein